VIDDYDSCVRTEQGQHVSLTCLHPLIHSLIAFLAKHQRSRGYPGHLQVSMLPPSSNDLFHSTTSYLSNCLNASWTAARSFNTLRASTALLNVLSLIWQPLSVTLPGGAGLTDHAPNTTGVSRVVTDRTTLPPTSIYCGGDGFYERTVVLTMVIPLQMSITAYDWFPNLDRRTLSIEWEILGCGEHKLQTYQPPDAPTALTHCGPFSLAADVYINE